MTDIEEKVIPTVRRVIEVFRDFIKREGEAQGHRDTGKMLDTMQIKVERQGDIVTGELSAAGYSMFVQTGVAAGKVRYPIKVMIDWWKRKGLNDKEAVRAAWATRAKHKKEGIGTKAANAFSKTGKRKGFVSDGIEKALLDAQALFEKELNVVIQFEINEIFKAELMPVFTIEI